MVARHAQGGAVADHVHHQAQHPRGVWAAVDQVTDENGAAAFRRAHLRRFAGAADGVAQLFQQGHGLVAAAVDVADDVEGTVLLAPVIPKALALDNGAGHVVHRLEYGDVPETFALQAAHGLVQGLDLRADDVRPEVTVGACGVPFVVDALRQIENDRGRQHVVLAGQGDQALAILGTHVGGVDDGQPTRRQALGRNEVQDVERVLGDGLVVLVVAHQASAEVGRDDLRGQEVLARKRRLAGAGGTNQRDQRQVRDLDRAHRWNTPIWVGGPSSGSTGPMGRNSTW